MATKTKAKKAKPKQANKRTATRTPLGHLSKICAALPESTQERAHSHAIFRVRKKVYAYFLDDHHGDGIVAVACKAPPGDNAKLIASDPKRFYMPPYIGPRGWVALRLDVDDVAW